MTTMMTVATMPRDEATLAGVGVYIHRRLAEELLTLGNPVWKTDKEKSAFVTAQPVERAKVLLQKVQEMEGGASRTPVATAPVAPPTAPAPAPAPEEAASRRPRTQNTAAAAAPAAPAGNAGVQELLLTLKGVSDQIAALSARLDNLEGKQADLSKSVGITVSASNDLKSALTASMKIQQVQLGLLCLFGQQVLGGVPASDFLPTAIDDANQALDIIERLGKG
jgi:hypothetical protein